MKDKSATKKSWGFAWLKQPCNLRRFPDALEKISKYQSPNILKSYTTLYRRSARVSFEQSLEEDYKLFAKEFGQYYSSAMPTDALNVGLASAEEILQDMDLDKSAGFYLKQVHTKFEAVITSGRLALIEHLKLLDGGPLAPQGQEWQMFVDWPTCPFLPNFVSPKLNEVVAKDKVRMTTAAGIPQLVEDLRLNKRQNDNWKKLSGAHMFPAFMGVSIFYGFGRDLLERLRNFHNEVYDLSGQEYSRCPERDAAIAEVRVTMNRNPDPVALLEHNARIRRWYALKFQIPWVWLDGTVYANVGAHEDSGNGSTYPDNCIDTHLGLAYALSRMLTVTDKRLSYAKLMSILKDPERPGSPPIYSFGDDVNLSLCERAARLFLSFGGYPKVAQLALQTGHLFTYEGNFPVTGKAALDNQGKLHNTDPWKQLAKICLTDARPHLIYEQLCGAKVNLHNTEVQPIIEAMISDLRERYHYPLPTVSETVLEALYS